MNYNNYTTTNMNINKLHKKNKTTKNYNELPIDFFRKKLVLVSCKKGLLVYIKVQIYPVLVVLVVLVHKIRVLSK